MLNFRLPSIVLVLCAFINTLNANELAWDPQLIKGTLDNGMRYVAYPNANEDQPFNLRLIVNAGSIDDELRGMAHVVEHMVFRANRADAHSMHHYFEQIGWKTGLQINAMTRQSETQYMVRTRPNDALNLDGSIKLLSDLAFGAKMLDKDWQVEREVIIEEMRRGEGVAERVNTAKKHIIRHGSRYVDRPTIGYREDLARMTVKDIKRFYQRFYVPSNMTLIASGHFDEASFVKAVENHFGAEKKRKAPVRDYVELPLHDGLYIGKIQDPQGTSSYTTLGFRSALLPRNTLDGEYQRLQQYFLRKLLPMQVKAGIAENDERILSLHSTLKEPTNERLVFAIAAKTFDHNEGLKAVLREVARLKQHGLNEAAFEALRAQALKTVENNQKAIARRDFAQWEDKLTTAIMQNTVEQDAALKAIKNTQWIKELRLEELNARLRDMLNSGDSFLYYQVPHNGHAELPSEAEVNALAASVDKQALKALLPLERSALRASQNSKVNSAPAKTPQTITWPALKLQAPKVVSKRHDLEPDLHYWTLDNGDRVVWLNQASDNGKVYLKALSQAGYKGLELSPWLSQTALQIWQQSALPFADAEQLKHWQKTEGVSWQWQQNAHELDLSATVKAKELGALMRLYYVQQQQWQLASSELKGVKAALNEQVGAPSPTVLQRQALFNEAMNAQPSQFDVDNLSIATLKQSIAQLQGQNVTLYMVGKLDEADIEEHVLPYLGNVKRQASPLKPALHLAPSESQLVQHIHDTNKATLTIKSERDMTWSPEASFLVSTFNPMLQQALKNKLRHELGGVYSLRFELRLDKDNVVRGLLELTTGPEKVAMLTAAYNEVLADFGNILAAQNLPRTRDDIAFAEQLRLSSTSTWLRRLSLSDQRYQGAHYLRAMHTLSEQVNHDALSALAQQVLPFTRQATLIGLPKQKGTN